MIEHIERRRVACVYELQRGGVFSETVLPAKRAAAKTGPLAGSKYEA